MRDVDIRDSLKETVLKKYLTDVNSRVVSELSVGYYEAIIDMAVINGSLHGFEIKSEYDTLSRLPSQLAAYVKTFDYLTVITAKKHLAHVVDIVPDWCGIILVEKRPKNKGGLKKIREAKKNKDTANFSIAQLLWRDEVIDALKEIGINTGIKSKPKAALWSLLALSTDKETLSSIVREKLKARRSWKFEKLPSESDGYCQLSSKL